MASTYRVQVLTKTFVPELGHEYSDAQYLEVPSTMTLEDVKVAFGAQIQAEENKRIAARIFEKQNPTPQPEPTKEQLIADKEAKLQEIALLDAQIAVAKPATKVVAEDVVIG